LIKKVTVSLVDTSKRTIEKKEDIVAEEAPLHIFVNETHYATILCLPNQLKELAVGYLLSEGIIKTISEIQEITMNKQGKCQIRLKPEINIEKRISLAQPFARIVLSSCGSSDYWPLSRLIDKLNLPKLHANFRVKAEIVSEAVRGLTALAEVFRKTGGVHVAALYTSEGKLITYAEDIGRHNAIDKVIGTVALKDLSFSDCFLASSGRLTGDIVLKTARVGIPVLASLSAAVSSGVETARVTGLTLIGFVRGTCMNIFSHPERIILED
jgi:FdhD protein